MTEPAKKGDGSTAKPGREGVDTSPHQVVVKLLGDADPSRDLVVLVGYFGPSKKRDSVRLYLDLDFRAYFELPRGWIVSTDQVDPDDENSPTRVIVEVTAELELVQISRQRLEAAYLQGSITSAYLGGASGIQAGAARFQPHLKTETPALAPPLYMEPPCSPPVATGHPFMQVNTKATVPPNCTKAPCC